MMRRLALAGLAVLIVCCVAAASLRRAPASTPETAAWPLIRHVRTHAYYGLNGINADVPPSYMAAHVDIVEDDGFEAQHALAFKRAGGSFAMAYTDPSYVPYCKAPFAEPAGACIGPVGVLVAHDASAWIHDKHGARIHRRQGESDNYQEMLNPASPLAQRAYAQTTAAILQQDPLLDGFEADDSGSEFTLPGYPTGSDYYYAFGYGVELASDDAWIAAEQTMLRSAGKPLMINGSSHIEGPSYGGAFLDQRYVFAQQFEGYMNNEGHYLYAGDQFAQEEDGVLAVQRHRKWAMVMPSGDTSPAHRLYAYAAWLLVYDPATSVYNMEIPQADGPALYPETELVPSQPRATASATVAALRVDGVYVREFAACAIAAVPIGPCAAIVNADAHAAAPLPPLTAGYARHIELDARSLYGGGKARVAAGLPQTLAPTSAVIVLR